MRSTSTSRSGNRPPTPGRPGVELDHVHPADDLLAGFPVEIVSAELQPVASSCRHAVADRGGSGARTYA